MSLSARDKTSTSIRLNSTPAFSTSLSGVLILLPLLLLARGFAQSAPSFDRSDLPVGSNPVAVVVADFNGDGIPDIATANFNSDDVSVLLGNGDGSFQPALSSGTNGINNCTQFAQCNIGLVAGDLNGDGITDLVVLDTEAVTVLVGNGDGTFQATNRYFIEEGPTAIVMADFNGDGQLDIVVTGSSGTFIRLGNGDGTFQEEQFIPVSGGVGRLNIVTADFNGDGIPDFALANLSSNNVTVLLGNGDGTFQEAGTFGPVGVANCHNQPPQCRPVIAAGDLNGDGIIDLVVSDQIAYLSVLLGNGDGTFQVHLTHIFRGEGPASIALGDFNNDGILDYTAALLNGIVTVGLGTGDGSFQSPNFFHAGNCPASVAVGDFNGDGFLDIAVANSGDSTVSVLMNTSAP